mgnify:CR=1 FL=1
MRADDIEEMRKLPFFDGCDPEAVTRILRASFLQRFPAHVELIREGDPPDFLHLVIEGQVEMYSRYRDRETTIAVVGPTQPFILAAVLTDRVYLKAARALSACRILMLPADLIRNLFATDPNFARNYAVELASAYRDVVKELKNQKLRSSLERLANWLLRAEADAGGRRAFTIPFDKKVLAARLGMAPEVLSRSFAALAEYNVSVKGPAIAINDIDALRRLARPSATIDNAAI